MAKSLTSEYLLSGMVVCGACGRPMEGDVDPRRAGASKFYRCRTKGCPVGRVKMDAVDRAVVGVVLDRVLTPEGFGQVLARVRQVLTDESVATELRATREALPTARRRVERLLSQVEDEDLDEGDPLAVRLRERRAELRRLEQYERELSRRLELGSVVLDDGVLSRAIETMRAGVQAGEVQAARRALKLFVKTARVWSERVRVEFADVDLGSVFAGISEMPPRGFGLIPAPWSPPVEVLLRA